VSVKPGSSESYTIDGVDVYPRQPEPVDQSPSNPPRPDFNKPPFAPKPFTIDNDAYKADGLVPAAPASGQILGQSRDIVIGGLQIPAAQYDAADHQLRVLNTVDVRVTFDGGPKTFSPELNSPWERAQQRLVAVATDEPEVLVGGDVTEVPDERAHQGIVHRLELGCGQRRDERPRARASLVQGAYQG